MFDNIFIGFINQKVGEYL